MTPERAVIVGASHAGAQLAANLRREGGWAGGEVVLIGDEGGTALPQASVVEGIPGRQERPRRPPDSRR